MSVPGSPARVGGRFISTTSSYATIATGAIHALHTCWKRSHSKAEQEASCCSDCAALSSGAAAECGWDGTAAECNRGVDGRRESQQGSAPEAQLQAALDVAQGAGARLAVLCVGVVSVEELLTALPGASPLRCHEHT